MGAIDMIPEPVEEWIDGVWNDPRLSLETRAVAAVAARYARERPGGGYAFQETPEFIQEASQALELLASVQRATEGGP